MIRWWLVLLDLVDGTHLSWNCFPISGSFFYIFVLLFTILINCKPVLVCFGIVSWCNGSMCLDCPAAAWWSSNLFSTGLKCPSTLWPNFYSKLMLVVFSFSCAEDFVGPWSIHVLSHLAVWLCLAQFGTCGHERVSLLLMLRPGGRMIQRFWPGHRMHQREDSEDGLRGNRFTFRMFPWCFAMLCLIPHVFFEGVGIATAILDREYTD